MPPLETAISRDPGVDAKVGRASLPIDIEIFYSCGHHLTIDTHAILLYIFKYLCMYERMYRCMHILNMHMQIIARTYSVFKGT